jgi:hypothetical protein
MRRDEKTSAEWMDDVWSGESLMKKVERPKRIFGTPLTRAWIGFDHGIPGVPKTLNSILGRHSNLTMISNRLASCY